MAREGWATLFASAFHQSRNPMVLVDGDRRIVECNGAFVHMVGRGRAHLVGQPLYSLVVGGPRVTPSEWREALAQGRFTGAAHLIHADGHEIAVQWGGTTELVTGRRLVLFVALSTSRWGSHFRRTRDGSGSHGTLSAREEEVVHHVASGKTGQEIASELGIAHETVRTHVRNAMTKLGARSRAHLVAKTLAEHTTDG